MKRINRDFLHFIVIFQFGPKAARSLVHEFDSIVRLELGCILDEVNNHPDAAELEWANLENPEEIGNENALILQKQIDSWVQLAKCEGKFYKKQGKYWIETKPDNTSCIVIKQKSLL